MITVFFDGKCGLCSKEILHYAKLAHPNTFAWQDVANEPNLIEVLGVSQEAALRRLHARDVDGRWHIGVAAFKFEIKKRASSTLSLERNTYATDAGHNPRSQRASPQFSDHWSPSTNLRYNQHFH